MLRRVPAEHETTEEDGHTAVKQPKFLVSKPPAVWKKNERLTSHVSARLPRPSPPAQRGTPTQSPHTMLIYAAYPYNLRRDLLALLGAPSRRNPIARSIVVFRHPSQNNAQYRLGRRPPGAMAAAAALPFLVAGQAAAWSSAPARPAGASRAPRRKRRQARRPPHSPPGEGRVPLPFLGQGHPAWFAGLLLAFLRFRSDGGVGLVVGGLGGRASPRRTRSKTWA